jgi:hypothetical protein
MILTCGCPNVAVIFTRRLPSFVRPNYESLASKVPTGAILVPTILSVGWHREVPQGIRVGGQVPTVPTENGKAKSC